MALSNAHKEDVHQGQGHRPYPVHPRRTFTPKSGTLTRYVGYSVSFVSFCVGLILLTGLFIRANIPTQLRVMVGVVFLLMGVYRFFATRFRLQQEERGGV